MNQDAARKRLFIIIGSIVAIIAVLAIIISLVFRPSDNSAISQSEITTPVIVNSLGVDDSLVFVGFNNLERLRMTDTQIAFIEEGVKVFLKDSEGSTTGVVQLTGRELSPVLQGDDTFTLSLNLISPKDTTYTIGFHFSPGELTEYTIYNSAGTAVYESPRVDYHEHGESDTF